MQGLAGQADTSNKAGIYVIYMKIAATMPD